MDEKTPRGEDLAGDDAPRWHIVEFVPLPSSMTAGPSPAPAQSQPSTSDSEPDVFAASGPALDVPPARVRTASASTRPLFQDLDTLLQTSTAELEAISTGQSVSKRRTAPPAPPPRPDPATYAVARNLVASRRVARQRWRYVRRLRRIGLFIILVLAFVVAADLAGPAILHQSLPLPIHLGPFTLFSK